MSKHIDTRLTVLKYEVTNQRFVFAVLRRHLDKCHLVMNWPEAFDLNPHRTTNHTFHCFLRGGFHLDFSHRLQISKSIAPSHGQNHERRAGINQRITPNTH